MINNREWRIEQACKTLGNAKQCAVFRELAAMYPLFSVFWHIADERDMDTWAELWDGETGIVIYANEG